MPSRKLKTIAVGLGATILVGSGAAAFAYWTGAGSGTGSIPTDAGTASVVVVNQTSSLLPMAPGVAAQALSGNFSNNAAGASPVQIVSVTASVASVSVGGTTVTGCTAADFTITGATMAVNATVPVGSPVGTWSGATIAFNTTSANQNACKGGVVHLAYAMQ